MPVGVCAVSLSGMSRSSHRSVRPCKFSNQWHRWELVGESTTITDAILEKLSSQLGASSETLHKIKFGRGVVGKIAVVAVFALGAIAVASVHVSPNGALIAIGAVVLLSFFVLSAILLVVMKQPELALLEGAELVMYKHMALGVKGGPPLAGDSGQPVAPTPPQDSLPAQDESQNGR